MSIYEQLEDSLYNAIEKTFAILNEQITITFSHQNGPEPKGNYVSINVLELTREGRASKSGMAYFPATRAEEYAVQGYNGLIQLSFYGTGAGELSSLFHSQFMNNTPVRESFLRNNLAPRSVSNLRRAPQLRDTVWVNSFAMDMRVGWAVRTIQDVDWADKVTVNGNTIPLTK